MLQRAARACVAISLLLAACSQGPSPARAPADRSLTPLLVDVDMGLDDARVLLALPAQRRFRVELVTSVEGSASARRGAENALRLLAVLGWHQVPVAVGAGAALGGPIAPPPWRGISDELGGAALPPARRAPERAPASALIVRTLRRLDRPAVVLALGPLTNLAAALDADPALARRVGSLHLLGDFQRCDCYNCRTDPEAARRVLARRVPVYMVVRSATDRLPFDGDLLARVRRLRGPAGRVVAAMMARHAGAQAKLWDDTVLAALLASDAVPYRRAGERLWRAEAASPDAVHRLLLALWDGRAPDAP
jgi:purine nucleosidase